MISKNLKARVQGAMPVVAAANGLVMGATEPALAAAPQVFPVSSGLVPLVVAAAFILPALLAATWSSMKRTTGRMAPVLGAALFLGVAIGAAAYVRPDLLAALRI
ncbi:MAG: hypothetical protein R3D67_02820 [Hyphomicrobiaceae bacterium]